MTACFIINFGSNWYRVLLSNPPKLCQDLATVSMIHNIAEIRFKYDFWWKKFPSVTYSSRVLFYGSEYFFFGNSEAWEWLLFNKLRCWKLVYPGWKDIFRSFFHQYFQSQFPLLTMFQLNKCGICMDSPFKNFAKFAWKHLFLIKLQVLSLHFYWERGSDPVFFPMNSAKF